MLLDIQDALKDSNPLKQEHRGIVVSTSDPQNLGRIKVFVQGILEVENSTQFHYLPWAFPARNFGQVEVPEVGSDCLIYFPDQDAHFPVYRPHYTSHPVKVAELFTVQDQANVEVKTDSVGNSEVVNKETGSKTTKHSSGTKQEFTSDGKHQTSGKHILIGSSDKKQFVEVQESTGQANIQANEQINIKSEVVTETAKAKVSNYGTSNEVVSGSKESTVDGGVKISVGGDQVNVVAGNMASNVGGDKSELVTTDSEIVVGNNLEVTTVLGDITLGAELGGITLETNLGTISLESLLGAISIKGTQGVEVSDITGAGLEVSNGFIKLGNPAGDVLEILDELLTALQTEAPAGFGSPLTQLAKYIELGIKLKLVKG